MQRPSKSKSNPLPESCCNPRSLLNSTGDDDPLTDQEVAASKQYKLLQPERQHSSIGSQEIVNPKRLSSQELFDHLGGEIAPLNPDNFWRRTQTLDQIHKISIGADHRDKPGIASPIE